jgi:hypothetical protein
MIAARDLPVRGSITAKANGTAGFEPATVGLEDLPEGIQQEESWSVEVGPCPRSSAEFNGVGHQFRTKS